MNGNLCHINTSKQRQQNHLNADDFPRGSADPIRLRRHRTNRYKVLSPIVGGNDRPIASVHLFQEQGEYKGCIRST
eukprot:6188588-Pleurochrysis_carterae.AAC.5